MADVLPGVIVFACGLALTVAPLTATVLGAAPEQYAGVASAVNNDVARTAGLIAVAVLPPLAGISNADFGNPTSFSDGFHLAMVIAGATLIGWVLSGFSGSWSGKGDGHQECEGGEARGAGTAAIEGVDEGGNVEGPLRQGREQEGGGEPNEDLVVERRPLDRADISVGLMRLTPTDRDRLLIFTAAELARS